jgi:hypothetical protein
MNNHKSLTNEYVLLYTKLDTHRSQAMQPAPDFKRLASIPWRETLCLIAALTGTAERVLFKRNGDCVIPVIAGCTYGPLGSLSAVFASADEISSWLHDAGVARGVPAWKPDWLAGLPLAPVHLLGAIRKRVASSRSIALELRDLEGRKATITIPPRQALTPPKAMEYDLQPASIDEAVLFTAAVDRTGAVVHIPIEAIGGSVPLQGDCIRVERSALRREHRLTAEKVTIRLRCRGRHE